MRRAQKALADFLPLIDWPRFRRRTLSGEVRVHTPGLRAMACGDDRQAVLWLVRTDVLAPATGRLRPDAPPLAAALDLPSLRDGAYKLIPWDTREGRALPALCAQSRDGVLPLRDLPLATDLALAVTPA
jgi:mannan endo-1,4-beta-mannosidase